MALIYKKITIGGSGGTDDKTVKVSTDDTQSGFLEDKIIAASARLGLSIINPGANEQVQLDVDETAIDHNNLLNYDVAEHRIIDDLSTTTTSLWSSDKIQTELDSKINAATPMTDNKLVKSVGTSGVDVEATGIDVDDSNNVTGINNLIIDGDLTVNGTTTTVNTTNLDVTDANITVNDGGTQASADAQDAGLTVEMSDATDAIIGYDSTVASKFKIGDVVTSHEIVSTNHTQTIINKTIDVDNNTVSNIETDNLKAGVLQTDISGGVSDTNLASSQAIKTYVDDAVATKDQASEISYDNLSSGLVATDVQAAIDEVEDRVDTAETTLASHIDANPGKHSASQINNTPAGNIAATDVQAAINELDSEKYAAADFNTDFDARLATKSTTDLAEGTNQYYTAERAQDDVGTILVDSASIDLTYDDVTPQITATVIESGVNHNNLNNYFGNEHINHTNVEIQTDADSGLTGGGNIAASRSLSVDINGTTEETSADNADTILIYDNSAGVLRKMSRANLLAGIPLESTGDLNETSFSGASGASAASVTGFNFANGSVRSFEAQVSVVVDATADLYEEFEIRGIQRGADWQITVESRGDDTSVDFNIDNTGQITYSSPVYAGFVSMDVKFRAKVTTV